MAPLPCSKLALISRSATADELERPDSLAGIRRVGQFLVNDGDVHDFDGSRDLTGSPGRDGRALKDNDTGPIAGSIQIGKFSCNSRRLRSDRT
jgi:hypothetical protein